MTELSPPSPDGRWWIELAPVGAVSRAEVETQFAKESMARFATAARARGAAAGFDTKTLTAQVRGFSLELTKHDWGRDELSEDGFECLSAGPKQKVDNHTGWSRVLDVYGRFCEPLAHYVTRHYLPLYALRPSGLPKPVNDSLKDCGRSGACNSLRYGLLSGFGGRTVPLFSTRDRVNEFIACIAEGGPSEADLHECYATLSFASRLRMYAGSILEDPWGKVINREKKRQLSEFDVEVMADQIGTLADDLQTRYSHWNFPSGPAVAAKVDELVCSVVDYQVNKASEMQRIRAATSSGSTNDRLRILDEESEHWSDAAESTRAELEKLVSLGHDEKTPDDALWMFKGRVKHAILRERARKRRRPAATRTRPKSVASGADPYTGANATESQDWERPQEPEIPRFRFEQLIQFLVEHRSELPHGLGAKRDDCDTAEFDITVELLDQGAESLSEIREFCIESWPRYEHTAIASDPRALADNVLSIVRWIAIEGRFKGSDAK